MSKKSFAIRLLIILIILMTSISSVSAKKETTGYETGFQLWRAADGGFADWDLDGLVLNGNGELELTAGARYEADDIAAGSYYGINYYNGGHYYFGSAVSQSVPAGFNFTDAIASWNAVTPAGTWIEVQLSAYLGDHWTKWYSMGIWASGGDTVKRHSVRLQGDADGYVAVDTLVLTAKKLVANTYKVKVILFSENAVATPQLKNLSVAVSNAVPKKIDSVSSGDPALWGTLLAVPECSQMVYTDGGNVWCSPTSTSMVVSYWEPYTGPCEPAVRTAVDGVYDWIYDGHGNWPFNTAYAGGLDFEAYVARFTSLDQVEPWVAAGVPVVFSYAWGKNDLTGAAVASSAGHLSVIVGFDEDGNPIVNDPAAASNENVQRMYLRAELEALWLANSGGTVYLIYPAGLSTPQF